MAESKGESRETTPTKKKKVGELPEGLTLEKGGGGSRRLPIWVQKRNTSERGGSDVLSPCVYDMIACAWKEHVCVRGSKLRRGTEFPEIRFS